MTRRLLPALLVAALVGGTAVISGCAATAGGGALAGARTPFTRRALADLPPVRTVDVDSMRTAYPDAPFVYLTNERTIEHQFDLRIDSWDFVQDVRRQYVVLDPDDRRAATFALGADHRDVVEGVFLRVTSPAGDQQTFALGDLVREADGGGTTYKVAYPNVAAGSVVEESFRLRRSWDRSYQPPLYHDVRLQYGVPAEHLTFRYAYPSSWGLAVKQTGPSAMPAFALDRESVPHTSILTAQRDHVPAFADEPYSPFFKEVGPYLEFAVTSIHTGDVLPIYQAPTSWETFARPLGRYVFKRRGGATSAVAQQARTLSDPAAPDSVRLAAVVAWVQSTIERVDEGGADDLPGVLRTHRANDLLITGLTQALLEESGFDADFIVIHAASEGYFDPSFIDVRQFTAPAVIVRLEGADRVVFPYIPGLPITYLPEQYQGSEAMRLTADGFAGFLRLPSGDAVQSDIAEGIDVRLDAEGGVQVAETTTLRGAAAFGMRRLLDGLPADERETRMRDFVTYDAGAVSGFSYEVTGESATDGPVEVTLHYAIDDLLTVTPEEVLFQTGGLLSPSSLSATERAPGARHNPIRIYHSATTTKTITVHFPETWAVATELADVTDATGFGQAGVTYTQAPGVVTATQTIRLHASRAEASQYGALARLTGRASRLNVPTLVFSVGS